MAQVQGLQAFRHLGRFPYRPPLDLSGQIVVKVNRNNGGSFYNVSEREGVVGEQEIVGWGQS